MTAPAITEAVDPAGLGGERIHLSASNPPERIEMWVYEEQHSLDAIHDAWLNAPRRDYAVLGCRQYRQTAGRRFVQFNLVLRSAIEGPKAPLHIDEPPV